MKKKPDKNCVTKCKTIPSIKYKNKKAKVSLEAMKKTKFTRRQVLVSAASGLAVSMLAPKLAHAASKT